VYLPITMTQTFSFTVSKALEYQLWYIPPRNALA